MAKKSFFGMKTVRCDNGESAELRYYCLREKCGLCSSYGVLVEMERGGKWESASVGCITTSSKRIEEFLGLLCRNSVTPCTLREVLWEEINKI